MDAASACSTSAYPALPCPRSHDFPARWQGLLPYLVQKLATDDMQAINGVLSTADSIYLR